MIKQDIDTIKDGEKVDYGFFSNLTFRGVEGKEVVLEDKNGNQRRFYISLFKKYATLTE